MIRYYVYNLESNRNFIADDVLFERIRNYSRNLRIKESKRKDQLTFYAKEKMSKASMLSHGNDTTSVNDIMRLLSLAQSRNIFYPRAKDTKTGHDWGMALAGNRKVNGFKFIMEHEIELFLNTALEQLRKPNWLENTGFNLALFWWLESIYENRPLETKFISGFIALEILANIHANSEGIKNKGVRTRIEAFSKSHYWDFLDSILIRDWTDIRDKYMHTGSTKSLKSLSSEKRATRYFQLVTSLQLILIDLLGFSNCTQREYVISEIKKPIRKIFKQSGPFTIP